MKKKQIILVAVPLICGLLSVMSFIIYLYAANHAPYRYTDIIIAGPVLSFIGIIASVINIKAIKSYPLLWLGGILLCAIGFGLCLFIFLALLALVSAL